MRPNSLFIKKPLISEKATDLAQIGKYIFSVTPAASSFQIKEAIENIYSVHITKMNILNKVSNGKKTKKAIVTLLKGEKIDIVPH